MNDFLTPGSHRIKAVVGHYGSGKTEIAINLAIALKQTHGAATIVDMDIVNPFFRTAEHADLFLEKRISLIAPTDKMRSVDLPTLGPEVLRIFKTDEPCVIDVGGDDTGAAALGRYKPDLERSGLDLFYVVNPFRPYSENEGQLEDLLARVELRARQKVTGLIINANLAHLTGRSELLKGREETEALSRATGLPIVLECGTAEALSTLEKADYPRMALKRYTIPEWLRETEDEDGGRIL